MKKVFLFFVLFMFVSNTLIQAQVYPKTAVKNVSKSEVSDDFFSDEFIEIYEKAENFFVLDNFYDALPLFLKLDSLFPNNSNICFNVGVCYIKSTASKSKAVPFLERAAKKVSLAYTGTYNETAAPVYAYYYLAKAYHITYRLNDAINNFQKFASYLSAENDQELLQDVRRQIEMCYNAKKIIDNPLGLKIENLGEAINSKYPEYSPIVTRDGLSLYITSRREGSTGNKKDLEGKYYEDVYVSHKNDLGQWLPLVPISGSINSPGHEATISISPDETEIFIYRDEGGDGNIYVSKFENMQWSKPKKLGPNVNTKYWETHACLSPDGQILYFTSDRPGGQGGRDIYRSMRTSNGDWGPAQNLGITINTPYDEESPFISADGVTLYFSSMGHESMGGFDIFTSTFSEDGFWEPAENIGYPINTCSDDVFYVPTNDEKHAYYSSVKNRGFGEQDIYLITITSQKKQLIAMRGNLLDANTYKALQGQIEIVDKTTGTVVANILTNPANGEYNVSLPNDRQYQINISANDYESSKDQISIASDELLLDINKNFYLTKTAVAQGREKINAEDLIIGRTIVLKDIYYDFDKATLRPESVDELNRLVNLMNDIPTLKIELGSHTDNKGSDEYNQQLSENRAKSVVDYLISKGITQDRLQFKGYGETRPIATNSSNSGRQKNRRTEIKILAK